MALTFKDRVQETTTTTGTGTLTLAGAVAGFQAWSAIGNANTAHYSIAAVDADGVSTGEWEVGLGTYTLSGTTLARTTVYDSSNAGSLVSFAAGTKRVALVLPTRYLPEHFSHLCEFRLSTESGVPVSAGDRSAQSLVYAVPFNGNRLRLLESGVYVELSAAQITSGSLTGLTSSKQYDWLLFRDSGVLYLDLGPAWASDTSRGTGAGTAETEIFEGVEYNKVTVTTLIQSKSVAARAGLVVGTCRTTATTTIEDSLVKRFLFSRWQQVQRHAAKLVASGHTYASATWRQFDGNAANQVEIVHGAAQRIIVGMGGSIDPSVAGCYVGMGFDSITIPDNNLLVANANAALIEAGRVALRSAALGYHYYSIMQAGDGSGGGFYEGEVSIGYFG